MTDGYFRFDDASAFAARMDEAPKVVQEETVRGINRLTIQGEAWSKQKLTDNGSVVTGHGRRSITHKAATFAGGEARGTFGTNVWYLEKVENGRRGFSAKGKKALAFSTRLAGPVLRGRGPLRSGMIFVKSVGPARPRPFMRPTVQRLRPYVPIEFRAVRARIIARLGG